MVYQWPQIIAKCWRRKLSTLYRHLEIKNKLKSVDKNEEKICWVEKGDLMNKIHILTLHRYGSHKRDIHLQREIRKRAIVENLWKDNIDRVQNSLQKGNYKLERREVGWKWDEAQRTDFSQWIKKLKNNNSRRDI